MTYTKGSRAVDFSTLHSEIFLLLSLSIAKALPLIGRRLTYQFSILKYLGISFLNQHNFDITPVRFPRLPRLCIGQFTIIEQRVGGLTREGLKREVVACKKHRGTAVETESDKHITSPSHSTPVKYT